MLEWVVSSSALLCAVLAVRALSAGRLSCRARYALWLLALVRMLTPVQLFTASWGVSMPELPERVTEKTVYVLPVARADAPTESGDPFAGDSFGYSRQDANGGFVKYADRWTLADALRAAWLAGAGCMAAALLISNLRFARRLRRVRRRYDEGVYVAEGLASPCLVGVLRPTVYLTPEAIRDERTLRHVLAHEETHRRHGDPLWSLLRAAALCLHWYNPLAWLAVRLSKRDGELACDEATLERLGAEERAAYGETLLALVRARPSARELLSLSTSMTAGKRPMRERIETIARRPRTRAAALALSLAVLLCATALAFSKGTEPEKPTPPAEPPEAEAPRRTDVWYADLDGDGAMDRVVLDTQGLLDEGTAHSRIELSDGTNVAIGMISTAHSGWNTVALSYWGGWECLLFYNPSMFQGEALYGFTLATVRNGQLSYLYATREEVGFSANPDRAAENDRAAMEAFRDKANAVWGQSRLLFTSDQEVLAHLYDADTGESVPTNGGYYIAPPEKTIRYTETMYGMPLVEPEPVDEAAFFAAIAGNYWFLSGAGGWHSELNVKSDGTFTGFYRDFDVKTVYYSDFAGRFDSVVKVNDFTYSMRLRELSAAPNEGEEHRENGVRWIGAHPYGIENTDELLVFMPGASVDKLPEDFLRWYAAGLSGGRAQIGDALPTVGLYCVDQGYGWFAWELIAPLVHEQQPEP